MNWLKEWLREWLEIEDRQTVHARINGLQKQVEELERELSVEQTWRFAFVASLQAQKAGGQRRKAYTDFESSQVEALEEFKEG